MKQYNQLPIPADSSWNRTNWWKRNRPIWFNEIIVGIKNLIKWFPVIWKDRDWDYSHIFEILKFKLIQQRKELVNANRHTGVDEINKYITLCLNLIERIQEDYYGCEYMDYHVSEYGWKPFDKNLSELEITNISDTFEDYFKKYPNTYRKIMERGNPGCYIRWTKETQAMELSRINQAKCQTLLFKILNEKINYFWD